MAQPLAKNTPPFCLFFFGSDGKYNAEQFARRCSYIKAELRAVNIQALIIATDSDTRYNSAMKKSLQLGICNRSSEFPEWFSSDCNFCTEVNCIPFQDTIHLGLKLRNRLLNKTLRFGKHKISLSHLIYLVDRFPKNLHNLTEGTIYVKDKQNFDPVLKICNYKVIDLLITHVKESRGTVLYLTLIQKILRPFLDCTLSHLQRIRYLWFSTFVLRIWRTFILKSKTLTLKNHFLSHYTYTCVEINAHALVLLMLYLKDNDLDHLFFPEYVGSQQCESIFRQFRSMTSTYFTKTNCSILEMQGRIFKTELLNVITQVKLKRFTFKRSNKQKTDYFGNKVPYNFNEKLPTKAEIIKEIELAKLEAIEYAETLGIKCDLSYSYPYEAATKNATNSKRAETVTSENAFEDYLNEDVLQLFGHLDLKSCVTEDEIDLKEIKENDKYVRVCNKNKTICGLLSQETPKLSNDRLRRVMQ